MLASVVTELVFTAFISQFPKLRVTQRGDTIKNAVSYKADAATRYEMYWISLALAYHLK